MNGMILGYDCLGVMIILLVIMATIWYLHHLNEMQLRRTRVRYKEELPLDKHGVPLYLPEGAQVNPERQRPLMVEQRAEPKEERPYAW